MPPTNPKGPLLSKRQHRMLQDMGIDVFFSRQAVSDSQIESAVRPYSEGQPSEQGQQMGQAQTRPEAPADAGAQQPSPASAARAALAQSKPPAPEQRAAAIRGAAPDPNPTDTEIPTKADQTEAGLTIELSFVATPSLVWVGEGPLSELELRFLQDLASALHQAATGGPWKDRVRNSDFRWPIVEASGTPERAVTVFCEKHRMLTPNTAVIGCTGALDTLKRWLGDNTSHWLTVDALAQIAARGESKQALWKQLSEHVLAAK